MLGVDLVNVQGLTDIKAYEMGRILKQGNVGRKFGVVGLVETHEKYRRVEWPDGVDVVWEMREMDDKRGGGLMLLGIGGEGGVQMEKLVSGSRDVLAVRLEMGGFVCVVVVVYLDTRDLGRNADIYAAMNVIMARIPDRMARLVMGDFNGHVDFLGDHDTNRNGEMILDFMEKWNLIMLNADDRCDGLYTRVQGNERTVIDYYLVDERMHERLEWMRIDEEKSDFDLSDHCHMSAGFRFGRGGSAVEVAGEKTFYKVNDASLMAEFVSGVEEGFGNARGMNVLQMENMIKENADNYLRRTARRRGGRGRRGRFQQPWMTADVEREIKHRRELNRKKRRVQGVEYDRCLLLYKRQKELVKKMVRDVKTEYERKLAQEIRENRNSDKMWKMIGKLRGNDGNGRRVKLYGEDGEEIEEVDEGGEMMRYWRTIYQKDVNRVNDVWNGERRNEYRERVIGVGQVEHVRAEGEGGLNIPRIGRVGGVRDWMHEVCFERGDVERRLKRIKDGKQPGPDGMKGEIYKALGSSGVCVGGIMGVYNGVLNDGIVGEGWRESRTVMVPKVKRPVAKQHRPIALMNMGCKLFMGMLKDKMVEQRMSDWRVGDLQCGFTEGRRMQENLFVLSHCVEESYRMKRELVVVAVDFSKAFDSVERRALVEALKYYKCHWRVIDAIASVYVGDRTRIFREGVQMGEIEAMSGIRQGCTVSPHLFVMVVGMIIERLLQSGLGYVSEGMRVPVLFYADDGLLLARSTGEAERMIRILEEAAGESGLAINRDKSMCMVFNGENVGEDVGGVRVVSEMRYLGVTVVDKRDCYSVNRREKVIMAEKMSNLTYSVVARACDRVLIGKTYWKSVVLPSVLSSGQVMVWKRSERDRLQRIENGVWRKVFAAPSYTPVAALQGEIGCSSVYARDMKEKLKFVKYVMGCESRVVRVVFQQMRDTVRPGAWMRLVNGYMSELGLNCERLRDMKNEEIVAAVNEWEHVRWRSEVESKSTLVFYRMKEGIGNVLYDNGWGARLMFGARSNTLRLNWRGRFVGGATGCDMCGADEESLGHFLAECVCLRRVRERFGVRNVGDALGFGGLDMSVCWEYLEEAWGVRASYTTVNGGGTVDGMTARRELPLVGLIP